MDLVIVESPAKAKTIEKYLGGDYKVIASVGHIIDLPSGKLGVDVKAGFEPTYTVIEGKEKVINSLKKASKSAKNIYLAPDPDREGEAIAWHIASQIDTKNKNVKRVLFNEITKKGIQDGINNPGDINLNLVNAQQSRRILDRLVGYLISPLLWKPLKAGLSAGRVQSIALRFICEREREIEVFVPVESWSIDANFNILSKTAGETGVLKARLDKINGKKAEIKTEKEALGIIEKLPKKFNVKEVTKKEVKQSPQPAFITSRMQQEAIRKFGFTAKKVMSIAQQLYEGIELKEGPVGLITYMRTDSTRISPDAAAECADFVEKTFGKEFMTKTVKVNKKQAANVQDAHEAIRPTSVGRTPKDMEQFLTKDQYRLYKLIWERFVASCMADAVYNQTSVVINGGIYDFKSLVRTLKFAGFTKLYIESVEDEQEEDAELDASISFDINENAPASIVDIFKKQHFTESPPRFTEASLVKTLEQKGIGRPSTYASIISTIVDREYVKIAEKKFHPTELGRIVNDLLVKNFPKIFEVKFTANMEKDLDLIGIGKENWKDVLASFYKDLDEELKKASGKLASEFDTDITCPECKKERLGIKYGRQGAFLACSGYPECKFTSNFKRDEQGNIILVTEKQAESIGVNCEKCGKELVLKRSRFGEMVACSGYPECKNIKNFMRKPDGTIKIIESGETVEGSCPKCDGKLVIKSGRNGLFAACKNYPQCKFTSAIELQDDGRLKLSDNKAQVTGVCEKCGNPMVIRRGPRGTFLACSGYPNCKNAKSLKAASKQTE